LDTLSLHDALPISLRSIVVYIDTIPSSTAISFKKANLPNHVNNTTTFTLTAQDNTGGSGVASIQYQYTGSGGNWISYISPFMISNKQNGSVMIMYRAIDNAGNVEAFGNITVQYTVLPNQPSFWETYGTWIGLGLIGIGGVLMIGIVLARKKKTSSKPKSISSKASRQQKTLTEPEEIKTATPSRTVIEPKTPPKLSDAQSPIIPSIGEFNLYCPSCQKWYHQEANTTLTGSETCPACSQALQFVPKCDACGNGVIKTVTEFNAFVNSNRACDHCGKQLRIQ
jgi:hypothetical protein